MKPPAAILLQTPLLLLLLLFLLAALPSTSAFSMSAAPSNPSRLRLVTNKRCPFAQKAWIALEEYHQSKANAYELLEVGLYGGNGKPRW